MAHQSHNLPWNTLASNFKYAFQERKYGYKTHLEPVNDPQRGKKIEHFVQSFARLIAGFSRTQQQQDHVHDDHHQEFLQHNERIIDTKTAVPIQKSLRYAQTKTPTIGCPCGCPTHFHRFLETCSCGTSTDPTALEHWLNYFRCKGCCCKLGYKGVLNLTKVLLLHDRMEPLLRIAAHPAICLGEFYDFPWEHNLNHRYGWAEVLRTALYAYIALNLLCVKPETWPCYQTKKKAIRSDREQPVDYRLTAMYQRMVIYCTATQDFDVHALPHRLFFGITHGALKPERGHWGHEYLVGRFPLSTCYEKEAQGKHAPNRSDVESIEGMLRGRGLPMELVVDIMELAEYKVASRLVIPDDPLHPANAEELRKYLGYCWRLMVRCDELANVCERPIDWKEEVRDCIWRCLFHYPGYPKAFVMHDDYSSWHFK